MQCRMHHWTFLAAAAARSPLCFHVLPFMDTVSSLPVRAQIWPWFVLVSPFWTPPPPPFHPCLWDVHVLVFLRSSIERKDWKRLIPALRSKDTKVCFYVEIPSLVMTEFSKDFHLWFMVSRFFPYRWGKHNSLHWSICYHLIHMYYLWLFQGRDGNFVFGHNQVSFSYVHFLWHYRIYNRMYFLLLTIMILLQGILIQLRLLGNDAKDIEPSLPHRMMQN